MRDEVGLVTSNFPTSFPTHVSLADLEFTRRLHCLPSFWRLEKVLDNCLTLQATSSELLEILTKSLVPILESKTFNYTNFGVFYAKKIQVDPSWKSFDQRFTQLGLGWRKTTIITIATLFKAVTWPSNHNVQCYCMKINSFHAYILNKWAIIQRQKLFQHAFLNMTQNINSNPLPPIPKTHWQSEIFIYLFYRYLSTYQSIYYFCIYSSIGLSGCLSLSSIYLSIYYLAIYLSIYLSSQLS